MSEPDANSHPRPGLPPSSPPHHVAFPVNLHQWVDISFLHWPLDPDDVQSVLPQKLRPLTLDGAAWIGVTPFRMRTRLPGLPQRFASEFPETNVRTYVAGPDGRQGLWFLHMEASAGWFVAVLRLMGLPYVRQQMAIAAGDGVIRYRSHPTETTPGGHDISVKVGPRLEPAAGGAFERFLTARWGAYHRRGTLLYTPVEHPPWQLHSAEAPVCEVASLFTAAGLPAPAGPPVVHHSPGVSVRVGRPLLAGESSWLQDRVHRKLRCGNGPPV